MVSWVFNASWYGLLNLGFWFLYHNEFPIIEKYKINPEPWPWKEDREAWDLKIRQTIKVVLFNNFILIPSTFFISTLKDNF